MTQTVNPAPVAPAAAPAAPAIDIFTDFAVQDEGVWHEYKGGVEFQIARWQNPKFRRRLSYFNEKFRRVIDGKGEAAEAKSAEIMATVMSETILLGWKGNVALQGEVLPYSTANAARLLAVPLFREWVATMASDEHRYKVVQDEVDHENL